MAIKAGLVGLPNVGKSTLFNALTRSSVPAENYPFCTIDPHVAITNVPDERLDKLMKIFGSQTKIPATMHFVDIAGLVRGAAQGEGLGNQFLSHIMEVDLVLHVLRCFNDSNILHVQDRINPLDDFETIITELMLKDLESLSKRVEKLQAQIKSAKLKQLSPNQIKELEVELAFSQAAQKTIEAGDWQELQKLARQAEKDTTPRIPLLASKKFLIVANVGEDELSGRAFERNENYQKLCEKFGAERVIPVSAKIEAELAQLSPQEAVDMLAALDITSSGLDAIIARSYHELDRITFFTCGPKEAHAWGISRGSSAPEAAGEIHSDLQRGFICAEVYNCRDLFAVGSEQALRASGKIRTEGKEYVITDGDVVLIRFNV